MSTFQLQKGYIYPITAEKANELDSQVDMSHSPFFIEGMSGEKCINYYLVFKTYENIGDENKEFGWKRPLNEQEQAIYLPKFKSVLKEEIDINKLKYIEYCFYNSCDPTDFYELTEPPKVITLSEAIDFCKNEDTKDTKTQLRNEQFVTWFTKLASYEDCTYITHEWLKKNGFEKRNKYEYLYCNDAEEISAMLKDEEAGIWHIYVNFLDHGDMQEIDICTHGQFRMFIAICGLDNLVNEFKA